MENWAVRSIRLNLFRSIAAIAVLLISGCSLKDQTQQKPAVENASQPNRPIQGPEIEFKEAAAWIGSSTKIETNESNTKYLFEGAELLLAKNSDALKDAAMKGSGQIVYYEGSEGFLFTGGKVRSISGNNVVLEFGSRQQQIMLEERTRLCSGKGAIERDEITTGDTVVAVSPLSNKGTALSLRKGPMLVRAGDLYEPAKPVNFSCR